MSEVVLITTIRRNSDPRVQIEMAYIITSIFSPDLHSQSCLPCT